MERPDYKQEQDRVLLLLPTGLKTNENNIYILTDWEDILFAQAEMQKMFSDWVASPLKRLKAEKDIKTQPCSFTVHM